MGAGERWDGDKPMWPWDGTTGLPTVTPPQTWNYRTAFGYEYGPAWSGPAFTGASTWMQPVQADAATWQTAWPSALIGLPGWSVLSGGDNQPAFQNATQSIRCTGSFGLGLSGQSGTLTRALYLCLRGSGAPYQHPVVDGGSWSRRWLDGWNGTAWVAGNGNPVATPIGKAGDCWFRLTPGPSEASLAVQDGFHGDNNFQVWGFSG